MQIRYISHIINLVVQAFLFSSVVKIEELKSYDKQEQIEGPIDNEARRIQFRLLGLLSKGHNIVVHIRKSPGKIAKFR
jgi:hypothetical protein